jgi:hypothetical protein
MADVENMLLADETPEAGAPKPAKTLSRRALLRRD